MMRMMRMTDHGLEREGGMQSWLCSSRRSVAVVVFGYAVLVTLVGAYLVLLEGAQQYNDGRNIDATVIYAVAMMFPFGRALRHALRMGEGRDGERWRRYVAAVPIGGLCGLLAGIAVTSLLALVKFMNPISALGILLVLTIAGTIVARRPRGPVVRVHAHSR